MLVLRSLALLLILATALPARTVPQKGVEERAQALMQSYAAFGWSGVVRMERKGKVLVNAGYGLARRDEEVPCTPDTLFEIASIAKLFTACAILALEEAGELDLDDSIADHLPGVPEERAAITIAHLLAHTSGMPRSAAGGSGSDLERAVAAYLAPAPKAVPGEMHEYWNGGYALLAGIVEQVSGKSYMDFCRERLFARAGLRVSGFTGDDLPLNRQAMGYSSSGMRSATEHPYQGSYGWHYKGMGGVVTSAPQLLAFVEALAKGKLLKRKTVERMWTPVTEHQGLGWGVTDRAPGSRRIGHGGDVAGFHSYVLHYPDDGASLVVLSNVDSLPVWKVTWNLEAILFGEEPKNDPPPALAEMDLKKVAGIYRTASGASLAVHVQAGGLRLQASDELQSLLSRGFSSASADVATERFRELFEALRQGEREVLRAGIAPHIPSDWADRLVDHIYPRYLKRAGELARWDVVATQDSGRGSMSLWCSLEHDAGERWIYAALSNGQLSHLQFDSERRPPKAPSFVYPVGENELVAYDLEKAETLLRLQVQRKGRRVTGIQVQAATGNWIALQRQR